MVEAIIFDMDGTLVNSIPIYLSTFERILQEDMNIEPPADVIRRQFGKNSKDIMRGILEEMGIESSDTEIERVLIDVREGFLERLKDVMMLPGAFELLDKVEEYPLALATSSGRNYTGMILSNLGLDKYFDAIVTANDVQQTKPAPDVYLKAAELLEAKPARCLAFEDAVYGVRSARSAGMKVVAVTTGSSSKTELLPERPDCIITSLKDFDFGILK